MAKQSNVNFVLSVDKAFGLSNKARASLSAAIGGAVAAEMAKLDNKARVAFLPHIKWPGGRILNLSKHLSATQLKEVDPDGTPAVTGHGF